MVGRVRSLAVPLISVVIPAMGIPLLRAGVAPAKVRSVALVKLGSAMLLPPSSPYAGATALIAAAKAGSVVLLLPDIYPI